MQTVFSDSGWKVLSKSFTWLTCCNSLFIKKCSGEPRTSILCCLLLSRCFSTKATLLVLCWFVVFVFFFYSLVS